MSLLRKGAISPIRARIPPLFKDNFETGDFSKWDVVPSEPYGTIVTTPVYRGTYAGRLWTNNIDITPLLAKVFPKFYDTLYFRSFARFVAQLGEYRGAPWWDFVYREIILGVAKYNAKYYWSVDFVRTDTEVSAGVWYKVELMSSRKMGVTRAWIDGALLKETIKTPRTMSSAGYIVYPTQTPVDDGFYVDFVEISEVGPIG